MSRKWFIRSFLIILLFAVWSAELGARSWDEICRSGKLYVLTTDTAREAAFELHRVVMPIDREKILLEGFAKRSGLQLEYIEAGSFAELFSLLEAGRGDLISANLAVSPARQARFLFSEPFCYTREVVFTGADSGITGSGWDSLTGRTGWLLPATTYLENFQAQAADKKNVAAKELPATISHDDLIESVAGGELDYSVLDECDLDAWLTYRSGIRKLFCIRERVALAFAAAKNSGQLIGKLNAYIVQSKLPRPEARPSEKKTGKSPADTGGSIAFGDLSAIRKRGYIRLLTTNDAFGCYLAKGRPCGFEYELARRFGESLNVPVVTVIPADFKDLMRYLQEGRGDFIAANFTLDPARLKAFPGLSFGSPYGSVTQVLAGRSGEKRIKSTADLAGRTVCVRRGTVYLQTLDSLQKQGIAVKVQYVPDDERPLMTLTKVASGEYDLTIADDTFFQLAVSGGCRVKNLLALTPPQSFAWVVRKNNPQLLAAVNAFFRKENRSTFFNLCKKRYYSAAVGRKLMPLLKQDRRLMVSPYDELFKKYGAKYDFPWYFLAAMAYQESEFNPKRVSYAGAVGLMQLMPETAKEMGVGNPAVPENGIRAAAGYLAKMRRHFTDKRISPVDRLCFILASYNAGYGHVADARKLAAKKGLNPNVWFQQTEKALAMLEEPKYYSKAKCGYCRASETVPYVRNIILGTQRYEELISLVKKDAPGR